MQECRPRPIWNRLRSWVHEEKYQQGGQNNMNTYRLSIRGFIEQFIRAIHWTAAEADMLKGDIQGNSISSAACL